MDKKEKPSGESDAIIEDAARTILAHCQEPADIQKSLAIARLALRIAYHACINAGIPEAHAGGIRDLGEEVLAARLSGGNMPQPGDSGAPVEKPHFDVHCTGQTIDDLRDEAMLLEAGVDTPRQCYICKRQEGARQFTILVEESQDEPRCSDRKIELNVVTRTVGRATFHYKLCLECGILLERRF